MIHLRDGGATLESGHLNHQDIKYTVVSMYLSLAFDLNFTKLQIATDCLQVVKNFIEEKPCAYGPR